MESNMKSAMFNAELNAKLRDVQRRAAQEEAEIEEKKKNNRFWQMNQDEGFEMFYRISHGFKEPKEPAPEAKIYNFLMLHLDHNNAVMASQKAIMEYTGYGRTTVYNAIKNLVDNGVIYVLKSGSSNVYVVNDELIWKAANDKRKFCEFDGKVLISKSENPWLQDHAGKKAKIVKRNVLR